MIAETSFIKNICYISPLVRKKVTHPLTQKVPLMDNAWKLHVSTYPVYRKHYQFTFKKHYVKLSKIMSWKEFGFKKGDLVFVTQRKLGKRSNLSRWIYQILYPIGSKTLFKR